MSRFISLLILSAVVFTPLTAGIGVTILPRNPTVEVDGTSELLIKRIPEGSIFLLSVNKDRDVSHYQIQWYKDGQPINGETTQELRYPIALASHAGTYTVEIASPCAKVQSKPMQVVVEQRKYQINTEVTGQQDGIAGMLDETTIAPFTLETCKPNPVNDRATITFHSVESSPVTLKIVDLNGNVVATLINDILPAGEHSVTISTRQHNMSNSLYYYVLSAPGFTDTKPMMLVK